MNQRDRTACASVFGPHLKVAESPKDDTMDKFLKRET